MGEYLKGCESLTMKCRATSEEDMQLIFSKKRKVYSELENEYCSDVELEDNLVSPAASRTSGEFSKHDELNDVVKRSSRSPDLKNFDLQSENFETEISTSIARVFSRETTPTSELYGDSEQALAQLSPPSKKKSSTPVRRKTPNSVAPSAAELEEFFAAAEKYEQKRFAEKYNYDIVKDVPLEGKYQWVRLLP